MRPDRKPEDCGTTAGGSYGPMAPLVVFEPGPPARIVPSDPLGPWALPALERLLRAAEADHRPITLDLTQAPVSDPTSSQAAVPSAMPISTSP